MDIVAIEVSSHGYFFTTVNCTLNQLGPYDTDIVTCGNGKTINGIL